MSLPDDQPVRHQSFQNQVKSWISNSLFDKFTYTIRRGPIKGMKRKGGLAWIPDWLVKDHRTPEQKLFTDCRGNILRISPGTVTTSTGVDRLLRALRALL